MAQFEQDHFKPVTAANSITDSLVDEAVRSGKRDPDTISRLYADSHEAKAKEAAQRKKSSDLDFAKCTFKPTIFGSGAKLLSKKAAAAAEGGSAVVDADADAAKARHDKLYEDNACKVQRKAALAKKVQEEESKALTFKPVVNKFKAASKTTSSKYDQDGEEIKQPNGGEDSEAEDDELLPAHERLHKKAASMQQKRTEEHSKRAFLSAEHTFSPRLARQKGNNNNNSRSNRHHKRSGSVSADSVMDNRQRGRNPPRAASEVSGSSKSAAVTAAVEEAKARVEAKHRLGSPFSHHTLSADNTASSSSNGGSGSGSGGSRFEMLYQHGVQRGLVRLSAQVCRRRM